MSEVRGNQRALLLRVAREAMLKHGLEPDFSPAAVAEADRLQPPQAPFPKDARDSRDLL